ncbi:MAG: sigma-54-dependent Fis family transcriptional regulator [Deltaproteobacteria bacterium]|nr:sigma-54-dependent Fis family transcriptional regulator [Deltaproteobacteria bacterium]
MSKATILVVDDEKLICWSLKEKLEKENYEVLTAGSGEEAMEIINQAQPDLILQDNKLPGISGIELLEEIKKIREESLVIMMTAYGDVNTSVKAMKLGAYDFVEKPFDIDMIKLTIAKALETVNLKQEVQVYKNREKAQYGIDNVIGKTPAMQKVFEMVGKLSKSDATTVLLQGESGTGKDVIAKAIHYQSRRVEKPYMEINCTSLPDTLIESELFGHEKGAFTDAKAMKKGLFELTDGGTILLDEIGDMPMPTQAKLLRVIENKSFKRVGGVKNIVVDVRIIAATNKDLHEASRDGTFRADLFYRLKVFPIYLPPLRERKDDIPLLARHFIQFFNREFKRKVKGISRKTEELMMRYDWPGNVRELKNVIERAIILESSEMILSEHLPMEITMPSQSSTPKGLPVKLPAEGISMSEVEMELIRQALETAQGNQVHAARLLKMSRDTLRYRMKKYNLL